MTGPRAQLLRKAGAPPPDAMELAGMTDQAVERGSGKRIAEWLDILDAWGATGRSHPQIARWLVDEHRIGGWWSQTVTVAYERARGIRERYQAPDGYSVSVSRTINATAERVSDAFTDPDIRARWLPVAPIRVRTAKRGRSARFD